MNNLAAWIIAIVLFLAFEVLARWVEKRLASRIRRQGLRSLVVRVVLLVILSAILGALLHANMFAIFLALAILYIIIGIGAL